MTVVRVKQDIIAPGVAAGLLSTVALALCGKLHGKRASAPVSAVSHWVWPQEARRTARPEPRHLITGLLIHQTMSIGWAAFNALALAALRRALAQRDEDAHNGALAGLARISAGDGSGGSEGSEGSEGRRGSDGSAGHDSRAPSAATNATRNREDMHRIALAAATTLAAAVGDYIVVPKRFTPGFEYHLPVAHIAAVYVAFGAGLMVPFALEQRARRLAVGDAR